MATPEVGGSTYQYYELGGFKGVVKLTPPYTVEDSEVTDASNVAFRYGVATKMDGYNVWQTITGAAPGRILFIQLYDRLDNKRDIIYVRDGEVFRMDSSLTISSIQGLEAALNSYANRRQIHAVAFRGRLILTDGATAVRDINLPTNTTIVNLGGLDVIASAARCVGTVSPERVVVGYTTEGGAERPNAIRACIEGDPTSWAAAGSINAELREESDAILALHKLHRDCVIYRSNSIWVMRYVGGSLLFMFQPLVRGLGLFQPDPSVSCPRAVATVQRTQYFLGSDDFYMLQSADSEPVSIGASVRDFFFNDLNTTVSNLWNIFTVVDWANREVWWFYPSGSSLDPNKAVIYNWDSGGWTFWQNLGTDVFYSGQTPTKKIQSTFKDFQTGGGDGKIYEWTQQSVNSGDYVGEFITKMTDLGYQGRKRVDGIRILTNTSSQSYGLLFKIGSSGDTFQSPQFDNNYTRFNIAATTDGWFKVNKVGRFFQVKVRTEKANQPFDVTGVLLRWKMLGER